MNNELAPAPTITWRGRDLVFIAGLTFLFLLPAFFVLALALGADFSQGMTLEPSLGYILGALAVQVAAFLASIAIVGWWRGINWRVLGLRPMSGRSWWQATALGIFCIPLTGWVAYAVQILLGQELNNPQLETIVPDGFSWGALLGMTLMVGILGPFAEELMFRGVLFRWLRSHFSFWGAAIISSVIFGLFHVEPSLIAGTAVLGLCAAYVYEKSGSLWAPFLVHAINNAVKVILLYAALVINLGI